ncbi:MAG TPA: sigma-70 family RNA polymerase sigma factor [Vicinamibacterales bacterium]|nr:sigma-70 family RNA polymerase sigma factor [Vicinamibacterales bacterium]
MEQVLTFPRLQPVAGSGAATVTPAGRADRTPDGAALAATIRAAADGDQEAFGRLYAGYVRLVHAILLGRVPRIDVDDLVQDVFLAAYARLRELRDPAAFGGWIGAIARNRATDFLRQRRPEVELPAELPGGDAIAAESLAVLDAIRKLPEAYRDTLMLRLVEGMSGNEIAERTGLTPASVRVNLHRGMKLLREKLS